MCDNSVLMEAKNKLIGSTGELKDLQKGCVNQILRKETTFGLMPTGYGKSVCFQIPGYVFAKKGMGITLVISPLIALIEDQVNEINQKFEMHVAEALYGTMEKEDKALFWEKLQSKDAPVFVYTTPEMLRANMERFLKLKIAQLTIDEAHCVSAWGNDFRPSYQSIGRFIQELAKKQLEINKNNRTVIDAFTATAGEETVKDTIHLLGLHDWDMGNQKESNGKTKKAEEKAYIEKVCIGDIQKSNLTPAEQEKKIKNDRKNLTFYVRLVSELYDVDQKIADIVTERKEKKGVIFCSTKKEMQSIYNYFENYEKEIKCACYFGGTNKVDALEARRIVMEEFKKGTIKLIIATSAFGMGVNIKDISYVIHVSLPLTMEDYIQQCGRAGRDETIHAECFLFAKPSCINVAKFMIMNKYLLMYPISRGKDIREYGKRKYKEVVDYVMYLASNPTENGFKIRARTKEKFEDQLKQLMEEKTREEKWIETKEFQQIITCSLTMRNELRKTKDRKISAYELAIADVIYSMWYNEIPAFTVRKLYCILTGNKEIEVGSERKQKMEKILDTMIERKQLPLEKNPENKKYYFNLDAKECVPWAFQTHENSICTDELRYIPTGVTDCMCRLNVQKGQIQKNKRMEETEDITVIKYYLLGELEMMYRYSDYHGFDKKVPKIVYRNEKRGDGKGRRTISRSIIYTRQEHDKGKEMAGLFHIYPEFFKSKVRGEEQGDRKFEMQNINRKKKDIHDAVCRILKNLQDHHYIGGFKEITIKKSNVQNKKWDKRNGVAIADDDFYIRGVRILSEEKSSEDE